MRSDWFFLVLSAYHFLTDDSLQSADKDQQESRAAAGKPLIQCHCKIQYISKFTPASRGSPCVARLSCF